MVATTYCFVSEKNDTTPIWSLSLLLKAIKKNFSVKNLLSLRVCSDSNAMSQKCLCKKADTNLVLKAVLPYLCHSFSMCFALFSHCPRVSLFVCLLARSSVSVSTDLTGPLSKSPLSDDSPLFYRLCNPPTLTAWAFIGLSIVIENLITLAWWLKNTNRQCIEVSMIQRTKLS